MWRQNIGILARFWLDSGENIDFFGCIGFFLGDHTHFGHHIERVMLAPDELLVAVFVVWVKDAWVIWNRSKKCGFGKGEILGGFTKIGTGG